MLRVKCSMVVMLTPQSSMECFFDWTKKRLLIKSQAASTLGLFWAQNFKIGRCEILQKKSQLNYFDWPIQLDFTSNCHNFPKFYSQNYRIACHKIPTFWDLLDFLFRCEPYAWQLFNRSFLENLFALWYKTTFWRETYFTHLISLVKPSPLSLAPCVVLQEFLFDLTSSPLTTWWYYG